MKPSLEPFYVHLGERIQDLREKRGLSQDKLGQLLSPRMTRASIANIEAGKQRVLSHTLWQMAKALGVGPVELVDGRPEMRSDSEAALGEIEREMGEKLLLKKVEIRRLVSKMAGKAGT
jgi:transcriptional regulator with XRE-family HTH domain